MGVLENGLPVAYLLYSMCKKRLLNRLWSGIEASSKAAWIPILIVASFSLYYTCQNYGIQNSTDRPVVRNTGARIVGIPNSDMNNLDVYFVNSGREDATHIKIMAGTINSTTKETKLLASEEVSRLRSALWNSSQARLNNIRKSDFRDFLVICIVYSDNQGKVFDPDINFYKIPYWPSLPNGPGETPAQTPTTAEQEVLLAGFSCRKMER
jgi:hypothetical protein